MNLDLPLFYELFLKRFYLFIYFQREGEGGGEISMQRETSLSSPQLGTEQTLSPGMCPDQKSNQRLLALRDDFQLNEPHRSGLFQGLLNLECPRLCFSSLSMLTPLVISAGLVALNTHTLITPKSTSPARTSLLMPRLTYIQEPSQRFHLDG